jgi:bifunctional non-homologous end joining protein LigD
MLARPGKLPLSDRWSYEVKWDGFRAIVSTIDGFRVLSRRRWDMTGALRELAALPPGLVLDGEIVAFHQGQQDFPRLCERMLHGRSGIAVTYLIFDVLVVDGHTVMMNPLRDRRALLEGLDLTGPYWHTPPSFGDGVALRTVVCERGLEGVVAKRLDSPYRPGERTGWLKEKNPDYWRRPFEVEAMQKRVARVR